MLHKSNRLKWGADIFLIFLGTFNLPLLAWTDTEGGNHGGEEWTLTNGLIISGAHYNIGTFTIPAGATVYVKPYDGGPISLLPSGQGYGDIGATPSGFIEIEASSVSIDGVLEASKSGYGPGAGPGGAPGSPGTCNAGGGGGYAVSGGTGVSTSDHYGGVAYGSETGPLEMGSGGATRCAGATGGYGGGLVIIRAFTNLTISGSGQIQANGDGGRTGGNSSWASGGGGAGGGIYLKAPTISLGSSAVISGAGGGGGTYIDNSGANNGGNGQPGRNGKGGNCFNDTLTGGSPGIAGKGGDFCQNGGASAGSGGNHCPAPGGGTSGGGGSPGRTLIKYDTINGLSYAGGYWNPASAIGNTTFGPWPYTIQTVAPNDPTNLVVINASTNSLGLIWQDNATDETGFRLERSTNGTAFLLVDDAIPANPGTGSVTYTEPGLTPNTTYWHKVMAVSAITESNSNWALSTATATKANVPGTGFTTNIFISSVTVGWGNGGNPSDTNYTCETSISSDFSTFTSTFTSALTPTLTSLTPNTTYYFRVKTVNHSGIVTGYNTSWFSITRTSRPGAQAPSGITAKSVVANWDAGNPANPSDTDYVSEISTSVVFAALTNQTTTRNTFAPFDNLIQNSAYYLRVKAVNRTGVSSDYANLGSITTLNSIPSNFELSDVFQSSASFTWLSAQGSAGYQVDASQFNDFSPVTASTITVSTNGTVPGLALNTTYYFRIGSLNVDGVPSWPLGFISTATLAAIPGAGAITGRGGLSLSAIWGANGNPSGTTYVIEASTYNNFSLVESSAIVTTTNGTVGGLSPNTLYYMRVKARNISGVDTGYTSLGSNTTLTAPPQNAQFAGVWYSSAAMIWTNDEPASGFVLEWSLYPDFSVKTTSSTTNGTATTLTATGLAPNTTYYFQIGSQNPVGEISYALSLSTTTLVKPPEPAPFTGVGPTTITANWSYNGNPIGTNYKVQASITGNFSLIEREIMTTANSYNFSELTGQTIYNFRVGGISHSGAPSDWVSLGSAATALTIIISTQNYPAPATALQNNEAAMLKLTLKTSGSVINWTSLYLEQMGTAVDSDIEEIRIYKDTPPLGTYDGPSTDVGVYVPGARFTLNKATVSIPSEPLTSTPQTYFVVFKLASSAKVGKTMQAIIPDAAAVGFPAGIWAIQGSFPANSGVTTIQDNTSVVNIQSTNLAPASIPKGASNVALLKIKALADTGTADLTSMVLTRTGTATNGDILAIKIFRDSDFDDNFDPPGSAMPDEQINTGDSGGFLQSTKTVTLDSAQTLTEGIPVNFFIIVNIPVSAATDNTLGISLAQATDVKFLGPLDSSYGLFPLDSSPLTITDAPNTLTATVTDYPSPATGTQGEKIPMMKFSLSVNTEFARWTGLRANLSGSELSTDVKEVQLYKDLDGSAGFSVGDGLPIATATFQGGVANLVFSTQTINTEPKVYFLVYHINPLAIPGNTLTAMIPTASYLTVTTPNTTTTGSFPVTSGSAVIQPTLDTVTVTPGSPHPAPVSIIQGDQNVPMAKLRLTVNDNAAIFTGLRLDKSGGCVDTDVSAIKVWWDKNSSGNLETTNEDELISSGLDTFLNGMTNITFNLPQNIPVTPSYKDYFVSFSFTPTATVNATCGLTVITKNYVMLAFPDVTANVNFPMLAQTTINEFPDIISISTTSIAPSSVDPGTPNVPVLKLAMRTGFSQAPWKSVQFDRSGIASASDLGLVKLWIDRDSNGALQTAQDGPALGSASFPSGTAPITINLTPNQIIDSSTKTYFVTVDVSLAATPNKTFSLLAVTKDYFLTQSPNVFDNSAFPFQSRTISINEPPSEVTVSPISMAPSEATQGDTTVPFLALNLRTNAYKAYWNGLTLERTGKGADLDAENIRLYADDGDVVFEPTTGDTLLTPGNTTLSNGQVVLSFAPQTITTAQKYFFVALDISNAALASGAIGLRVANATSLGFLSPDFAGPITFESNQAVVRPTIDTLYATMESLPMILTQGNSNRALAKISLRSDDHAVVLNALEVTKRGSLPASGVKEISLWRDSGNGTLDTESDVLIGSSKQPFTAGNTALITLNVPEIITKATQLYFLSISIESTATINEDIGLGIDGGNAFKVTAPDLVSAALWESSLFIINDLPDTLTIIPASMDIENIYQGQKLAVAKLDLALNEDTANLTTLKIQKTGTLLDSQVSGVSLYLDSNGNNFWDENIDTLAAGPVTLSNNMATFSQFSSLSLSAKPSILFVTFNIAPNAVPNRTVGCSIKDSSYLALSGTDTVSSANLPFSISLIPVKDARIPTKPKVSLDGAFTNQSTQLHFQWDSSVFLGYIKDAEYAIGISSGAADIRDWSRIGNNKDVTIGDLALEHGKTYYISLRTRSDSGFDSDNGISIGLIVDTLKPEITQPPIGREENGKIILSWGNANVGPSGIMGYKIEERNAKTTVWSVISPSPSSIAASGTMQSKNPMNAKNAPDGLVVGNSFLVGVKSPGTYLYRVKAINGADTEGNPSPVARVVIGPAPNSVITDAFCYPNPFDSRRQEVNIVYTLNQDTETEIKIYDLFGSRVWVNTYTQGMEGARLGTNTVTWNGTDTYGKKVPFDVYICIVKPKAGEEAKIKIAVIH